VDFCKFKGTVGDKVRIINPIIFIRCGYPLGIEEMREEVDKHFGSIIEDLYRSVQNGDKLTLRDANGKYEDGTCIQIEQSSHKRYKNYKYFDIVDALAYARLKSKNFGGTTRSLHTKVIEELRGKETQVTAIKMVQTGEYYKGNASYDYWNGGYEYEPAGLTDVKTHKILTLSPVVSFSDSNWHVLEDVSDIRIESIHVEKIPNEMETPIEYEYRIKQLEKRKAKVTHG